MGKKGWKFSLAEPMDHFTFTVEGGLFRNTFLTYLVHHKVPFMYKGDSNVLIQNKELRDSEIQVRNLSFLVLVWNACQSIQ